MAGEEEADGMGMVDEAEEVRTGTGGEGDIMGNMVVWICMISRIPCSCGTGFWNMHIARTQSDVKLARASLAPPLSISSHFRRPQRG